MNTEDSSVLDLTRELIARPSNTPDDAGCCKIIAERLKPLGFAIEYINKEGVTNLWAVRPGRDSMTVLAGHTDIVPSGPESEWTSPPFMPTIDGEILRGRGAADMKSGLAAMVCAVERLIASKPDFPDTIAFLITSDEEGPAQFGTRHVVRELQARGIKPDYAIVGEASSSQVLGDRIIVGRRGSLGCNLRVIGKQGHVAYPHLADNPIHRLSGALSELANSVWDGGNENFPPTSFQVSNFNAGTGATNVIPGAADAVFNFRYSTESTALDIRERATAILNKWCPNHEADWWHSGESYLTESGRLIDSASEAVRAETGREPELFTGGGTSDGRFISPWGAEVIELGPINATIHKIDEQVRVADLDPLSRIYERTLKLLADR